MSVRFKVVIGIFVVILLYKAFSWYSLYQKVPDNPFLVGIDDYPNKVKLKVYYEALCSDSKNFILKQLLPTYNSLGRYISIEMVPYGKAKTIEEDGKIAFQCQHGPIECLANKIHACVLDIVTSSYFRVKFVACMISDNLIPEEAGERCAEDMNYNYQQISECAAGDRGALLLKAYGIATQAVVPKITFIPTIEVNGSQKIPLAHLLKNLKKEICQLLPSNIEECLNDLEK